MARIICIEVTPQEEELIRRMCWLRVFNSSQDLIEDACGGDLENNVQADTAIQDLEDMKPLEELRNKMVRALHE